MPLFTYSEAVPESQFWLLPVLRGLFFLFNPFFSFVVSYHHSALIHISIFPKNIEMIITCQLNVRNTKLSQLPVDNDQVILSKL